MKKYILFIAIAVLLSPLVSYSQPPPGSPDADPFISSLNPEFSASYEYGFDTDLDGGGEFNINRFGTSGDFKKPLSQRMSISLDTNYGFTDYDFSGSTGIAGLNPWGTIHRAGIGVRLNYQLTQKWGITGGPFIRFRGESGADFGDSLTGGGTVGFTYAHNRNLIVGAGIFISNRLEDDVLVVPGGILNWQVTEKFRISSLITGIRTELGPRLQLFYDLGNGFGISATGSYEFQRFRLDNDGVASNGIGDIKVLPVWGSIYYDVSKLLRLEVYSGAGFFGEMELEDDDGDRIIEEDFDTLIFIGGGFRISL